jgi:hypothetical protein
LIEVITVLEHDEVAPVTVLIDPVTDDLNRAWVDVGVSVVAVRAEAVITHTKAITVVIYTVDGAREVAPITVLINTVTTELALARVDALVGVITVEAKTARPLTKAIAVVVGAVGEAG